ncbi:MULTISPECIES: hypothetical protein [Streptomyces rochei group]|uniref:hypothetical protein n=1 Tax=Streptomyces rochei group TaxID=2867164 RepID=UPI0018748F54|nr:hypothetical protein [Streptomyces vinaceusdrappus]GHC37087.1 hypothetical protein GCM10010308_64540 [Streptomyces vinaceusdrappus]
MPQPHTITWSEGLHALAEADERVWLDQWARGLVDTHTLELATPAEPVLARSLR